MSIDTDFCSFVFIRKMRSLPTMAERSCEPSLRASHYSTWACPYPSTARTICDGCRRIVTGRTPMRPLPTFRVAFDAKVACGRIGQSGNANVAVARFIYHGNCGLYSTAYGVVHVNVACALQELRTTFLYLVCVGSYRIVAQATDTSTG